MSQSVSISFGLFFLASLLIGSMFYTTISSRSQLIYDAEDKENERNEVQYHSSIDIISASLSNDSKQIHIYVRNTGDRSITDLDMIDIFSNCTTAVPLTPFVNDTWIPYVNLAPGVLGSGLYWDYSFLADNYYSPLIWDSNETLNITIYSSTIFTAQVYTYCIASPDALVDYIAYNTTKV